MKQPFYFLSGWTHLGRVIIENLPKDIQNQLNNLNDAVTISKKDQYIRYVNHGIVTATSKRRVIDFYRRFKRRF